MSAVTIDELQIRINGSSTNAYASVDALVDALEKLQHIRLDSGIAQSIDNIGKAASKATSKVSKMASEFAKGASSMSKYAMTLKNFQWEFGQSNPFANNGADVVNTRGQIGMSHTAVGESGVIDAEYTMYDDIIEGVYEDITGLQAQIPMTGQLLLTMAHDTVTGFNETKSVFDRVKEAFAGIGKVAGNIKTAISPAIQHFKDKMTEAGKSAGQFFKSIQRIAMYRAIRSALKFITSGLKEGVENLAQYSKAIGETDSWAANSVMSDYATKLLQVKNAVGSAVMPVLSALQPVIMGVANAFIYATNALNMFFSALGGSGTYTKAEAAAVDYAATLDKSSSGAKKAAKELSAGFDELNVISDNSSSGGGSSTANGMPAVTDMFSEDVIPQWLIDNLELIKNLAIAIGLAFAGWKIASMFTDSLGKIAGIALAVAGAFLLVKGAIDAWTNGVDWANTAEMIGGTALLAGGLALAFGTVGAAIGLLVGGVAMLVIGIRDWIQTGELSTQTLALICAGVIAIGLAITLLTGSWIPIAIAGVVALGLVIYKYWDEIKTFCINLWTSVSEFFVELWENIKTGVETAWNGIKWFFETVWDNIKTGITNAWNAIGVFFTETVPTIIENVFNWFMELPSKIAYALGFVLGTLFAWEQNVANWIVTEVPKLITKAVNFVKELPSKIWTFLVEIINKGLEFNRRFYAKCEELRVTINNAIAEWFSNAIAWIGEKIPQIINEVIDWFAKLPEALVNVGKNMIKALWNGIVSMGTWLWDKVVGFLGDLGEFAKDILGSFGEGIEEGYDSVPHYASGGVVGSGQMFVARENGAELVGSIGGHTAVMNNDQIVSAVSMGVYDAVVSAMSQSNGKSQSIQVFLNGKQIEASTRETKQRRGAVIANGGIYNLA